MINIIQLWRLYKMMHEKFFGQYWVYSLRALNEWYVLMIVIY